MRHGALKHRYLHLAQRAPRSNAMSGPKPLLHVQLVHYRLQTSRSLFIRANSRQHRIHGCIVRIWDAAVSPLRCLSTPVEGAFLNTPHLGGNYTKVIQLLAIHSSLINNCCTEHRASGLGPHTQPGSSGESDWLHARDHAALAHQASRPHGGTPTDPAGTLASLGRVLPYSRAPRSPATAARTLPAVV